MFEKVQHTIDGKLRGHKVPGNIRDYANKNQTDDSEDQSVGVGRSNVPTLPDIYYALTKEGYELLVAGRIPDASFTETEKQKLPGARVARIKFEPEFEDLLEKLKNRIEAGEFPLYPETYKKISKISIAVNLMGFAVEERKKEESKSE